MSEREDEEVAVDTVTNRRRGLGPRPRPPSQWGTPDTRSGGLGPRPTPPSQWAPPIPGGSLGFGGDTSERRAMQELAELALNTERDRRASAGIRGDNRDLRARPPFSPEVMEEPATQTFADWLAQNTGTFDSSPYDDYMNFLLQQDEETMARINAMYSQLADSAGENMQRVTDVYDSARIQSGDVFGGSAQNIEDAYGSASQQAADQMARLGIEAAAPGVLNPMALSQAEAVSGIERAGAGALDALTRYGTSAQDFGGQMAQVGQQQGLEVTSQILRDMQQRQAEAAFQRAQAQASFDPYSQAIQRMQLENMYNEPMLRAQEQFDRAQQEAVQLQTETTLSRRDRLTRIWEGLVSDGVEPGQAMLEAEAAVARAEQLYPMP